MKKRGRPRKYPVAGNAGTTTKGLKNKSNKPGKPGGIKNGGVTSKPEAAKSRAAGSSVFVPQDEDSSRNDLKPLLNTPLEHASNTAEQNPPAAQPTFCGKSALADIRPMIKEWLGSTDTPSAEDIRAMTEFLEGLIRIRDICLVAVVFRCIQRNIGRLQRAQGTWRQAFAEILAVVQRRMVEDYGKPLAVQRTF